MKNELNELTRVEHFFVVLSRTSVKEFVEGTPHRTGIRIRVESSLMEEALEFRMATLAASFCLATYKVDEGCGVPSAGRFSWPRLPCKLTYMVISIFKFTFI